jgi:hypothetical protein
VKFVGICFSLVSFHPILVREVGTYLEDGIADCELLFAEARGLHELSSGCDGEGAHKAF